MYRSVQVALPHALANDRRVRCLTSRTSPSSRNKLEVAPHGLRAASHRCLLLSFSSNPSCYFPRETTCLIASVEASLSPSGTNRNLLTNLCSCVLATLAFWITTCLRCTCHNPMKAEVVDLGVVSARAGDRELERRVGRRGGVQEVARGANGDLRGSQRRMSW